MKVEHKLHTENVMWFSSKADTMELGDYVYSF